MNLTDQQLLDRAAKAGWKWFENDTDHWPGVPGYPVTGWLYGPFRHCKPEQKTAYLRGELNKYQGFNHDHDCHECGKPIWLCWSHDETLIKLRECFTCNYWKNCIRNDNGVIVNHDGKRTHYVIGSRTEPSSQNGFGGTWFTVHFLDGRKVKTCDLWCQGTIPEIFWNRLPVNATLESARK